MTSLDNVAKKIEEKNAQAKVTALPQPEVDKSEVIGTNSHSLVKNDRLTVELFFPEDKTSYMVTAITPTPCDALTVVPVYGKNVTNVVLLNITVKNPDPKIVCPQVVTGKTATGEIIAGKDAIVEVYLNGQLQTQ